MGKDVFDGKDRIRLEISGNEIFKSDYDYEVHSLSDFYLTKIFQKANELGLAGKRIKEIVKIKDILTDTIYIDFVCPIRRY